MEEYVTGTSTSVVKQVDPFDGYSVIERETSSHSHIHLVIVPETSMDSFIAMHLAFIKCAKTNRVLNKV